MNRKSRPEGHRPKGNNVMKYYRHILSAAAITVAYELIILMPITFPGGHLAAGVTFVLAAAGLIIGGRLLGAVLRRRNSPEGSTS